MNRKPVFDTVRALLGRGFTQAEVERIDRAIDAMLQGEPAPPAPDSGQEGHRLGSLSERFESGGRGPGTVSSGQGDPGGVSYGTYQLASRTGTVAAFLEGEGAPWREEFAGHEPGSTAFTRAWQAIAARESAAFGDAQHAFIRRSHYDPAVAQVLRQTGLDLDSRHDAVRDAVWSVAVQHGRAAAILIEAVARADRAQERGAPGYDGALIEAIYQRRSEYVLQVAARSGGGARRTLEAITRQRYPAELAAARQLLARGERTA